MSACVGVDHDVHTTQARGASGTMTDDDVLALYHRSVDAVYRYASRLCGHDRAATDELVQETFLTLIDHVRRPGAEPVDTGWLIVACRSRFLDRSRRDRRRGDREARSVRLGTTSATSDEPAAGTAVAARLAVLPAEQRAALVLRYVDDLAVTEVAKQLGRSVHATESLLARGRAGLRQHMSSEVN